MTIMAAVTISRLPISLHHTSVVVEGHKSCFSGTQFFLNKRYWKQESGEIEDLGRGNKRSYDQDWGQETD